MSFSLTQLAAIIDERSGAAPEQSWTAKLVAMGPAGAARKFGEESIELVIAACAADAGAVTAEAADVLYHLLVVLRVLGVPFDAVMAELERRTDRSGLDEKKGRPTA
jgi:phosphoribosyl-ATP pyrophosphohydrolase